MAATSDKQAQDRIRVLIVDGHAAIRHAIAAMVSTCDDMELVGEACGGQEAVELCDCTQPHVVLMGVVLPDMTGAVATRRILDRWPLTRVIGLSSFQDEGRVPDLLRAGAAGYLLKNVSAGELASAIRSQDPNRGVHPSAQG